MEVKPPNDERLKRNPFLADDVCTLCLSLVVMPLKSFGGLCDQIGRLDSVSWQAGEALHDMILSSKIKRFYDQALCKQETNKTWIYNNTGEETTKLGFGFVNDIFRIE